MPKNKAPQEKQSGSSTGRLIGLFFAAAAGIGFNAYMVHDMYQDHLIDAEDMKNNAAYEVNILSSRDGENRKGDDMTAYMLSKDFILYAAACTKDRTEIVTGVKVRVTGEFSAYDSFTFPEELKQERAKQDYRLHTSMENNFHLMDIINFYRGLSMDQLDKSSIRHVDINVAMANIVQDNDEKYNTKTKLLDVSVVANKEDDGASSDCTPQYYQKPLVP